MKNLSSSTWNNCGYVYLIPSKEKNLIVESFSDTRFEISKYNLEEYDFSEYENNLIGFFVSTHTTQGNRRKCDSEIIIGDITLVAEDGKTAYMHNLLKFEQYGEIDLVDLMEFYNEDLDEVFEELTINEITLDKPLFDLDTLKELEPYFLNEDNLNEDEKRELVGLSPVFCSVI